jgi:NAD(P)-dependent dehydrogenase (short-subunit alcohol dehydrogenase family)
MEFASEPHEQEKDMLLTNKNAVIYGAGGAIGGAIARAFAREGSRVFLTGRRLSSVEAVAKDITARGGVAETARVDALDEQAIEKHLSTVVEKAGGIDISINAIAIPQQGVQGIPLVELSLESFALPITTYMQSHFLTTRAAGRRMIEKQSGVILTLTATPARLAASLVGGMAPAWAGIEALTRSLAAELGPRGIRAICLRSDAIPETETITEVYGLHADALGMTREQFQALSENMNLLKRLPTLAEVANVAAFLASDQASAMTATVANLSCGLIVD